MAEQLVCSDCGTTFAFTAAEADFFASRGLVPPKRCPECRNARKAAGRNAPAQGSRASGGPRRTGSPAADARSPSGSGTRRAVRAERRPRYTGDVNEYRSPMQVPSRDIEYRAPSFPEADPRAGARGSRALPGSPSRADREAPGDRTSRPAVQRPTFEAVCSACGAAASVPFEPEPGREVFCQACHRTRRGGRK